MDTKNWVIKQEETLRKYDNPCAFNDLVLGLLGVRSKPMTIEEVASVVTTGSSININELGNIKPLPISAIIHLLNFPTEIEINSFSFQNVWKEAPYVDETNPITESKIALGHQPILLEGTLSPNSEILGEAVNIIMPSGTTFRRWIERTGIVVSQSEFITEYQGTTDFGGDNLNAHDLAHALTIEHFGKDPAYNQISFECYGGADPNYIQSRDNIDKLFNLESYSFSSSSIVYKGVRSSLFYYQILDLASKKEGDVITFPSYLSVTASRMIANSFGSSPDDHLLTISRLEKSCCLVPLPSMVKSSSAGTYCEQEILLSRGTIFKVLKPRSPVTKEIFIEIV